MLAWFAGEKGTPKKAETPVGAVDVLTEPRGSLLARLSFFVGGFVVGVVLLAVPGPYLSRTRVVGIALLLVSTGAPPIARRLLHGGHRLEIYEDHFWFSSRLGDATVRWQDCGPFRTHVRTQSGGRRRRGWATETSKTVDFYGLVAREPTLPWRLPRRGGGQRSEGAVIPSRYGMSATALAGILNMHREAALALTGARDLQAPPPTN